MWLILTFILMQSYTACLSSIMVVHQLQPSYPNRLKYDRLRVKNYPDMEEYKEALDKGSNKGGVDAIFDHVSHIKIFLNQYGSKYVMVETGLRTDGFAFAFPKGSNLTSYFSRAILNVRESEEMDKIEEKYFGSSDDNEDQGLSNSSSNEVSSSLTTYSFAGLFIVIVILSLLALLVSESHLWQKPVMLAKTYSRQFLCRSFSRTSLVEGSTTKENVDEKGFTTS
ncbi:glutamate receptor 2.5-like isoform X2 [Prosopis cineraria]|uniref:glutamate receptor 2.5-like isoform X2 n=1 Tax=Prosopis cineraria TaxID=364024 RepID=UPI00240ECE14|nr:glutamate receptor 2.5-like isoform X2 [Prosopis cineraria]